MASLKAVMFLLIIVIIWLSLLLVRVPLLLLAFAFDKYDNVARKDGWLAGLFYTTDVDVNKILGGYRRTTISAEIGNLQLKGSSGGMFAASVVNKCWYKLFKEENHCVSVMLEDDKYLFSPFKALCGASVYIAGYFYTAITVFTSVAKHIN